MPNYNFLSTFVSQWQFEFWFEHKKHFAFGLKHIIFVKIYFWLNEAPAELGILFFHFRVLIKKRANKRCCLKPRMSLNIFLFIFLLFSSSKLQCFTSDTDIYYRMYLYVTLSWLDILLIVMLAKNQIISDLF